MKPFYVFKIANLVMVRKFMVIPHNFQVVEIYSIENCAQEGSLGFIINGVISPDGHCI
jgi:hypothetical protein